MEFENWEVRFKSKEQLDKVIQIVVDLANLTQVRENNGFTPTKLYNVMGKKNRYYLIYPY